MSQARVLSRVISGWLPPAVLLAVLVAAWELAVRIFDVQDWLLPPPMAIAVELADSFDVLMQHAGTTAAEIAIGFIIAAGAAAILASAIAWSRLLERSIYPLVIASQTIPIIALAPLLLVWIGPDITSKVVVVVLISFFPIVVNLADGLRNTDVDMTSMMRTLGASRRQTFFKLQVPMALPYFFSGLKVGAVGAVIGAVVGEWVGARGGLGWLMKVSSPQFLTERVFAAIFVLSIIAVLLFAAVKGAERWALRNHAPRG
jgi:ABC-type nitrate/sulfonate/bicarbonate transport system permease component